MCRGGIIIKKEKVLMFDAAYPPPIVGGKEKQAHLLAKALKRYNVDVDVLTLKINDSVQPNYFEGVNVVRVVNNFIKPLLLFFYLIGFRFKKNIIHIHTPSKIGIFVLLASKILRYKMVFKLPNENMISSKKGLWGWIWLTSIKLSNIIVVLENNSFHDLTNIGLPESAIFKVFNGIEMTDLIIEEKPLKQNRIIFIGRLVEQKGCNVLLSACSKLTHYYGIDDWYLYIIGDGPLRSEMEEQAYKLDISDKVKFVGFQSDIFNWLKKASLVALPSYKEGMSNVVLESMSMGVPVVASDVGNNKEMLGDDFLIPKGDTDGLAEKMYYLLQNEEIRTKYGKELFNKCKNNYDIDVIAKQYRGKYQEILNNHTKRS